MIEGAIAFFGQTPPRRWIPFRIHLKHTNAAVALEKTDAGVTFTVDNISVDDNFINLGRMQATGLRAKLQGGEFAETATAVRRADAGSVGFRGTTTCRGRWSVSATRYTVSITPLNDSLNFYFQDDDTVCWPGAFW